MSPNIKKLIPYFGIILLWCGLFSAALFYLASTYEEPAARPVTEVAEFSETAAEQEPAATASPVTEEPTDLPVSPPATATERPTGTRGARPSVTPVPTHTPRPSSTPRPVLTPSLIPSPTLAATATPALLPTATAPGREIATVTDVIDGDTIRVTMGGVPYRVRYIGIDTPETGDVCGREATAANAGLVAGQTVIMVRDRSETDRFGRLLRYVYVGDIFVNQQLVAGGWAEAVDYPPDTAMSGVLHDAMSQGAGRGCALVTGVLPTSPPRVSTVPAVPVVPVAPPVQPTVPPAPQPTAPPAGNCDPSYPTVCIPPPPPDLDCSDIPHRRFQVLPPDPHGFDGRDNDGIGCESG